MANAKKPIPKQPAVVADKPAVLPPTTIPLAVVFTILCVIFAVLAYYRAYM